MKIFEKIAEIHKHGLYLKSTQPKINEGDTYDITLAGEALEWVKVDEQFQIAYANDNKLVVVYYPELNIAEVSEVIKVDGTDVVNYRTTYQEMSFDEDGTCQLFFNNYSPEKDLFKVSPNKPGDVIFDYMLSIYLKDDAVLEKISSDFVTEQRCSHSFQFTDSKEGWLLAGYGLYGITYPVLRLIERKDKPVIDVFVEDSLGNTTATGISYYKHAQVERYELETAVVSPRPQSKVELMTNSVTITSLNSTLFMNRIGTEKYFVTADNKTRLLIALNTVENSIHVKSKLDNEWYDLTHYFNAKDGKLNVDLSKLDWDVLKRVYPVDENLDISIVNNLQSRTGFLRTSSFL